MNNFYVFYKYKVLYIPSVHFSVNLLVVVVVVVVVIVVIVVIVVAVARRLIRMQSLLQ